MGGGGGALKGGCYYNNKILFLFSFLNFFLLKTDQPECDIPSAHVEKSERQKWLTDICLEYLETYICNSDEVTVLVEQIRELHKAQEQPFRCQQPHCNKTYVYHSGRVK